MGVQNTQQDGGPPLPREIQYLILDQCEWTDHEHLLLVCKDWRRFILTSPTMRSQRYPPTKHIEEQSLFWGRQIPRLHALVGFYNALVLDAEGNWKPCRFREDSYVHNIETNDLPNHKGGLCMWRNIDEWPNRRANRSISGRVFHGGALTKFFDEPLAIWTPGDKGRLELVPGFIHLGDQFSPGAYRIKLPSSIRIHSNMTVRDLYTELIRVVKEEAYWLRMSSRDEYGAVTNSPCNIIELHSGFDVLHIGRDKPVDTGRVILDYILVAKQVILND